MYYRGTKNKENKQRKQTIEGVKVMKNRIKEELVKRFEENNWEEIVITMKCDGTKIFIDPCCYADNKTLEQVEYFLMNCSTMNLCGRETIEQVVEVIVEYETMLKESASDVEKCRQYWLKHVKNNTEPYMDDFYSDWHKELFGHRPRRKDVFPA